MRGLSLDDVTFLLRTHLTDLQLAFGMYRDVSEGEEVSGDALLTSVLYEAPALAASVIALGSGEKGVAEQAKLLPAPLQLQALTDIVELTFIEVGGPKNFFATLTKLAGQIGLDMPLGIKLPSVAANQKLN